MVVGSGGVGSVGRRILLVMVTVLAVVVCIGHDGDVVCGRAGGEAVVLKVAVV